MLLKKCAAAANPELSTTLFLLDVFPFLPHAQAARYSILQQAIASALLPILIGTTRNAWLAKHLSTGTKTKKDAISAKKELNGTQTQERA